MDISKVVSIPLKDIQLQGVNVRTDLESSFSKEGLSELAESIRINGLMQPIVLKGVEGDAPYDVVVGQRRFLAHRILGLDTIKATFTGKIEDIDALLLSLSENMCRQELNYTDTANAVTKLYNHYGKDEKKVQASLGLSLRTIRGYIKIEEQATDKIKELLKTGKITLADAKRAIDAAQGDLAKADILVDEIGKLTKYEKNRAVKYASINPTATVDNIISDAKKPKFEETVILNLPANIFEALKKASGELALDMEIVTLNAVTNWLKANEFLIEN